MKETMKIRWVIAHEPLSLFMRAAESFARAINEKSTSKQIDVEIMTLSEYSDRYNNGQAVSKHEVLGLMNEGKIEMSQMYTTWLAEKYNPDMHVLDMPFLFRDHDHAQKVLEGPVGEQLLAGLSAESNVRGLAFTYCGGFRMIPSAKAIRNVDDFKDLAIRSNRNPFAMETFRAVGANPIASELEEINDGVEEGMFVGGESAWPRVYPLAQNTFSKAMVDSKHSLFLTSMIVQSKFWESLDAQLQQLIKTAAVDSARQERAESVRDGEMARERAQQEGIEIIDFSPEETEKFKQATQVVYDKFEGFFTPGMINTIKMH